MSVPSPSFVGKLTAKWYPQSGQSNRIWAPIRVGPIEPVGMTKASTTNARKTKARMKATRIDSIVSFTFPSACELLEEEALSAAMGASYARGTGAASDDLAGLDDG